MKIWGVLSKTDCILDVCNTEKGVKRYATKSGYTRIGYRLGGDSYGIITHVREGGKWRAYKAYHKTSSNC